MIRESKHETLTHSILFRVIRNAEMWAPLLDQQAVD